MNDLPNPNLTVAQGTILPALQLILQHHMLAHLAANRPSVQDRLPTYCASHIGRSRLQNVCVAAVQVLQVPRWVVYENIQRQRLDAVCELLGDVWQGFNFDKSPAANSKVSAALIWYNTIRLVKKRVGFKGRCLIAPFRLLTCGTPSAPPSCIFP